MTTCAVDCCPQEPVVRLGYTAARTRHSYLLCVDHRSEAWEWVHCRFGDIAITEEEPEPDTAELQPCLFGATEVGR